MLALFLLFVIGIYKGTTATTTCCENGWIAYEGSCYLFRDETKATWDAATKYCKDRHQAHLVTVETRAEDMFLRDEAMRLFKNVHDRNHSAIWIGATDEAVEGVWRWYTDNSLLQYNSLMPSEYYDRDQDCILMWGGFNYDWGDFQCDRPEYFICEKRAHGHQAHPVG